MYSELMNKFLETSDKVIGIIIIDREKEVPLEYSLKTSIDVKDIEEISKAIATSLKTYESNRSKSDLITTIFITNEFAMLVDDYQQSNKILVLLYNPKYFEVKIVDNSGYLKKIVEGIKAEKQ